MAAKRSFVIAFHDIMCDYFLTGEFGTIPSSFVGGHEHSCGFVSYSQNMGPSRGNVTFPPDPAVVRQWNQSATEWLNEIQQLFPGLTEQDVKYILDLLKVKKKEMNA